MSKTIREAYGEALLELGKENPRVVVLDADVSESTKSAIFGKGCPERFFNMGIAEANMVGVAAGMASEGKIPFVNTFAVFLASLGLLGARAFGSYSELNIKFVGAYGGLSDSYDGPSHHSIDDIAVMRALPNFQVYVASDNALTKWLVKNAIDVEAPMYIRLSRNAMPTLYAGDEQFEVGKGKIVQEGTDVSIISCGVLVHEAVKAAKMLAGKGIRARVVDMFCIKPIDRALILDCAAKTKLIVTAEEHTIHGGLGGAVAEVLAAEGASVQQHFVGIADKHAETGEYAALLYKYQMDADAIAASVWKGLGT